MKYIYCYLPKCFVIWLPAKALPCLNTVCDCRVKLYHASTQSVTFNNWQGVLETITPVFRYWAIQCWRTYRSEKAVEVYTITSTCYSSKGVRRNMYTNSGKLTQKMPYYKWITFRAKYSIAFQLHPQGAYSDRGATGPCWRPCCHVDMMQRKWDSASLIRFAFGMLRSG